MRRKRQKSILQGKTRRNYEQGSGGRMAEVDAEEADDGGLFGISLDSSDESSTETQESEKKLPRDFQSEEDFQTVKTTYRPKVEIGEVCFLSSPLLLTR